MIRFFIITFFTFNLFAQEYTPTNFTGPKEEVRELFDSLWSSFYANDYVHCYRKAHVLAYQMKKEGINPMKVFIFAGEKGSLPGRWWYHVAPLVYYKGTPVVLDKGMLEGATFFQDWIDAFTDDKKCVEIFSMQEYRNLKKSVPCMYMFTDMYQYGPKDLEEITKSSFDQSDLNDMLYVMRKRSRNRYRAQYF